MLGANTWLHSPYQILVLRNVRTTGTAKLLALPKDQCHKTSPQMRIKRKKLHESSTTLRNNSKGRRTLWNVRARAQTFAWYFWREKSEVRFRTYDGALLKIQYVCKHIVFGTESVLIRECPRQSFWLLEVVKAGTAFLLLSGCAVSIFN